MTAKADRAKELLDNPVFEEAMENLRSEYRTAMEAAGTSDEDVLECRRMLHLSRRLEQHLIQMIQSGHLEDFRANEETLLGEIEWPRKH